MYVCMYIRMNVRMYVCVCMYVRMYVYVLCMYYVCTYYVRVYVCIMYVCIYYACMYVCMYVPFLLNAGLLQCQLRGCHRGAQVSSILKFYSVTSGKLLPRLLSPSVTISPRIHQ
jgi:hypothetical protein